MKTSSLETVCMATFAAFAVSAAEAVNDWENTQVNSINREPARAYSMPLADGNAALTDDLEPKTPYRLMLNGTWKISWCGEPSQRPLDFWKTDFDDSAWFTIDVPSCVEMRGFGSPGYTNVRYPHANMPPRILDRIDGKSAYNPVSSYRRTFTVPASWSGRDVFIRFDGVYSAYYVWVNGQKVGYAEDSKLPSEFNITKYLKPGENLLAVEVYRWCDGSYLEDQDMFRFSGIYRDVSIFATPKVRLDDFCVTQSFSADYKNAKLSLKATVRGGSADVSAELYDAAFKRIGSFKDSLDVPNVRLWSAEDPYLYTLVMKAGDDIRACRIGFKEVKIAGNTVLFNGKKIKFKGVDRHECSPENGRTVSLDEMVKDVTLFKRYNINTVRTSHYPDHHLWYDLCDRYGIYVMAEANVEAHEPGYGENGLGRHEEWFKSIMERNINQVMNYRNHASIAFWSMGNETGHGKGFVDTIAAVKALDPSRPVHWERGNVDADVDSTMYPTVEWLESRGRLGDRPRGADASDFNGKNPGPTAHSAGKPFFMCEYAHAMGNAIGNFQEYWDAFYKYDSLVGGCIWDWIDQAVWKCTDRIGPDGKRVKVLAYGGDFDEQPNDGPFCCNGVIGPTREVTPKLLEVAHVHRNIVVSAPDAAKGQAEVWNRFGFTSTDAFDATWELLEDGVRVDGGKFVFPAVKPLSRAQVALPHPTVNVSAGHEYFYNVSFALKERTCWAESGWVVARDQLPFKPGLNSWPGFSGAAASSLSDSGSKDAVTAEENSKSITVKAGDTEAVFCRKSGTLARLTMRGKDILSDVDGIVAGPRFTCARAFTDNDKWLRDGAQWSHDATKSFYDSGLTQLRYHARPLKTTFASDGSLTVVSVVEVTSSKSAAFTHETAWTFFPSGKVTARNSVAPRGRMPPALPRMGVTLRLDKSLENVSYYGRGPEENYIDRRTGAFLGLWKDTVTGFYEDYVRPQDCGYRTDVRWIELTDKAGRGVRFSADQPLFAQALHYTMEDLEFARHRNGQQRILNIPDARPEVILNLDVRQTGLGGASCGPKPMQKYIFPVEKISWKLTLEPIGKKKFLGLF